MSRRFVRTQSEGCLILAKGFVRGHHLGASVLVTRGFAQHPSVRVAAAVRRLVVPWSEVRTAVTLNEIHFRCVV